MAFRMRAQNKLEGSIHFICNGNYKANYLQKNTKTKRNICAIEMLNDASKSSFFRGFFSQDFQQSQQCRTSNFKLIGTIDGPFEKLNRERQTDRQAGYTQSSLQVPRSPARCPVIKLCTITGDTILCSPNRHLVVFPSSFVPSILIAVCGGRKLHTTTPPPGHHHRVAPPSSLCTASFARQSQSP